MATPIDGSGIDRVLADAVADGAVPHVAAIVADRDGVLYEGGAGIRVAGESDDPVGTSTHFRIMSMTKMVCTVAALQQKERGELDFDAPVEDYVPAFADVKVLEGFDGDEPVLVEPRTKATVHQLVTHTSGPRLLVLERPAREVRGRHRCPQRRAGVDGRLRRAADGAPGREVRLRHQHRLARHASWRRWPAPSSTPSSTRASPARSGMSSTTFHPDQTQMDNAVTVHVKGEDGTWGSAGNILNPEPDWWAGGHGLFSTPRDYIRFERALLRGGELDGVRILDEATVDAAFTNQIGDLDFPAEIPTADPPITDTMYAGPGHKWGYGLLLNSSDVPGRRRAGTGSWAGLFNTHFFIDRTTGICASIYTNSLPFIARDEAWKLYGDFEEAVYAAL